MWLVRTIVFLLILLPILVNAPESILLALLFVPSVAGAVGVAHLSADHEDEDEADFVSPVFWRALREGGWVFIALALVIHRMSSSGLEDALLRSLGLLAPAAVFTLAGCHVGVLFTKEHMSRQVCAFGAGALTAAYLVVTVSGIYYLLYSPYAELVWPMPVAILMAAGLTRIVARFVAGQVKIGSNWPLLLTALIISVWTVLVFPHLHSVVQKHDTRQLRTCEANLKNIGAALEMYSKDSADSYPPNSDEELAGYLIPTYLPKMPTCPESGLGYSFQFGHDAPDNETGNKDWYMVFCQGAHHTVEDCPPDYPRYSADRGLTLR